MNFNIIIAVWGQAYVASLCDITLPSLAPHEGASLSPTDRWKVLVYTREDDAAPIADCLRRILPIAAAEISFIEPETFSNHYLAMAHAHALGSRQSVLDGAKGIIVPPDAVFSAGALATVASIAKAGKRAIMISGPRVRETAGDALKELLARGAIAPRDLVALSLTHLHPEIKRYFWTSTNFSTRPFMCCWNAPGGWLSRNFHLHPLMIDFAADAALDVLSRDTIDGEFIGESIGIWDDIHVVQDSDVLAFCTLTPDDVHYSEPGAEGASIELLRETAYEDQIVNPLHRWLFTKAIKIHAGDLDDEWKGLEERTGRMAFEILSLPKREMDADATPKRSPRPAKVADLLAACRAVLGRGWSALAPRGDR